MAVVSGVDVADGELIDFEGEFCFPCRSIDVPAMEFSQVLLAAAAFQPLLDFWEWMVVQRGVSGGKCHKEWGMGNGEWGMGNGEWGMGKTVVNL